MAFFELVLEKKAFRKKYVCGRIHGTAQENPVDESVVLACCKEHLPCHAERGRTLCFGAKGAFENIESAYDMFV